MGALRGSLDDDNWRHWNREISSPLKLISNSDRVAISRGHIEIRQVHQVDLEHSIFSHRKSCWQYLTERRRVRFQNRSARPPGPCLGISREQTDSAFSATDILREALAIRPTVQPQGQCQSMSGRHYDESTICGRACPFDQTRRSALHHLSAQKRCPAIASMLPPFGWRDVQPVYEIRSLPLAANGNGMNGLVAVAMLTKRL